MSRLPGSPATRLIIAAALVLSIPLVAGAQLVRQGNGALAASDAALASGNLDAAITDARRASFAEVPVFGADRGGYARLESIARDAEGRGDEDHALKAWSAVRAAAMASDGLVSRTAELHDASEALARLYTRRAREAAAAAGPQLAPDSSGATTLVPDEETLARSLESGSASFGARARRALGFTAAALLVGAILLFLLRGRSAPRAAPAAVTAAPPSSDTGAVD